MILIGIICIPYVLTKNLFRFELPNALNSKKDLSGVKKFRHTKDYALDRIKQSAKAKKVTINDFISAVLSQTVAIFLEQRGQSHIENLNVSIPINIKFHQPESLDQVDISNAFSIQACKFHIDKNFDSALNQMHTMFSKIKRSYEYMSTYMISLILGSIVPFEITYKVIHEVTKQFSFVFTNVPGPFNPIFFKGKPSKKAWIQFIPAGNCGVAFSMYTHNGIAKISISSDVS